MLQKRKKTSNEPAPFTILEKLNFQTFLSRVGETL